MKILHVNKFYFPRGGSESYYFSLERLLREFGHEVIPFALSHSKNLPSPWEKYFLPPVDFSSPNFRSGAQAAARIFGSREAVKKSREILWAATPDLVHLQNAYRQMSPSILKVFKERRLPVVWTLHDYYLVCSQLHLFRNGAVCTSCRGGKHYNATRFRCVDHSRAASFMGTLEQYAASTWKWYERGVDHFIAPSIFLKNLLVEWKRIPAEKISVLPYTVDPAAYDVPVVDEGYVLYLGRLSQEKGAQDVLTAAWALRDRPFRIVGTGPQEGELRAFVEKRRMLNVQFLGFLEGRPLVAQMARASVIVVPSRWWENYPMVILEAMMLGKPVIASRMGGIPEMVKDGERGWLFDAGNIEQLREKIRWVMSHPVEAHEVGARAKKWVRATHLPSEHYAQLKKIYEKVGVVVE
ncbi:MAG: glycosyltransferase family 4 protein [Patescibacteria group bacterium]|mgnify:CR=1 FL=1